MKDYFTVSEYARYRYEMSLEALADAKIMFENGR